MADAKQVNIEVKALTELREEGYNVSEAFVADFCSGISNMSLSAVRQKILDTDLRSICGHLPPHSGYSGPNVTSSPLILQIMSVRDLSVPKAREGLAIEGLRTLRVTATDGSITSTGLEYGGTVDGLSATTLPGTKLSVASGTAIERGFLLLNSSNTTVLGGTVTELVEERKFVQRLKGSRKRDTNAVGDNRAPPWVDFAATEPQVVSLPQAVSASERAVGGVRRLGRGSGAGARVHARAGRRSAGASESRRGRRRGHTGRTQ